MRIIFLLLISLFLASCSYSNIGGSVIQSTVQDNGDIEVYFCPQDSCDEVLVNFIDSAEESIHCALFDIGLQSVKDVLDKKAKQDKLEESNVKNGDVKKIDVKVIIDNNYLKKYTRPFVKTDSWSLMHNKFCIIDGKRFSTGSMNPTDNGAFKNNNNLLLINSKVLANNYEAEFQEMWNGTFKKGDKVLNPVVSLETVNSGNDTLKSATKSIVVENYFCPEDACAEQVKEELKKAKESIHFMTFSFTHDGIANILLLKNQEGIEIKGVMEARQISKYSKFELLEFQGIDVIKDGNKNNMHHKVFIIDKKTVITGSFNPSAGGNTRNDENILIIHDEEIAEKFVGEFWKVYEGAEGVG